MFALGIDFITRVAGMTDVASREKAEWPPHPARIFMSLAAAHYETRPLPEDAPASKEAWAKERLALEWLEKQGAPEMCWPDAFPRNVVKVYVPVNDVRTPPNAERVKDSELRSALSALPDYRSRQERTFPAVYINANEPESFVYLAWPEAKPPPEILDTLKGLAAKVTRIGHSSSLAWMWVEENSIPVEKMHGPDQKSSKLRGTSLRILAPGLLADLDQCFNAEEIDAFFDISEKIATSRGRAKDEAKTQFSERFGTEWSRTTNAPVRRRPTIGLTASYTPKSSLHEVVATTPFDPELLILTKQEGRVLGLESTSALTAALRGLLLQGAEGKPEWFTGHSSPGTPSTNGHMALIPLPFVGSKSTDGPDQHADGHVLGLAIAFPRKTSVAERANCLRGRLFDELGKDLDFKLVMGDIGVWVLRREERNSPPMALRSETWTEPSYVWASATPIVLDRHPKHDQRTERAKWAEEVAESIARSCEQQGLPRPKTIDVDKTSWHRGAPRSHPGSGGMPWLPSKSGTASRQQVHALIQFPCEVQGPLLLGAGRFRGYGLCKPLGNP